MFRQIRCYVLCARIIPLVLWAAVIAYFSLTPTPPTPESSLVGLDKLAHGFAYALLTLTTSWYVSKFRSFSWKSALLISCAVSLYGGTIEIAQKLLTEARTGEFADLCANIAGTCFAWLVIVATHRIPK
jgi:VanZ family protein